MTCDWAGYHRSGIALVMHHRLQCFGLLLSVQGVNEGNEHTPALFTGYCALDFHDHFKYFKQDFFRDQDQDQDFHPLPDHLIKDVPTNKAPV